ncbi:MAG: ABC transporter ATP-binding protein, partial [Opitutales bacterium]|nr:ABC transporter ATP-binding protein [Opitutales bacterium]
TTQEQKKRAKLSNKERAELESIPSRIEEIEAERAELSAKLEDSEYVVANFDKLEAINKRLEELNAEDEYLMQRWEELDARA